MAKRRRVEPANFNDDDDGPITFVDRNEFLKLTRVAKSWEFTCSFCFKKFPSAQAMGGHQNAHRTERLEEKRLFVRDPIGYRKRAYLRAVKASASPSSSASAFGPNNMHAAAKMAKHDGGPEKSRQFNDAAGKDSPVVNNNINEGGDNKKMKSVVVMNFLPPKELSLVENVGVHAEDSKGKACIDVEMNVNGGVCGVHLDHKLDLTLKL